MLFCRGSLADVCRCLAAAFDDTPVKRRSMKMGKQTPLCRVDKIPVRWPRQRSWITAHFEKWWAICRPPPKCRAARQCAAPFRGDGAHRWALFGRIHGGGDNRRTAREYAAFFGTPRGVPILPNHARGCLPPATDNARLAPELAAGIARGKSAEPIGVGSGN